MNEYYALGFGIMHQFISQSLLQGGVNFGNIKIDKDKNEKR